MMRTPGRWWVLVLFTVAAAFMAAYAVTFSRNAWAGAPWPKYAGVHRGNAMVFSTVWNRPPPGVQQWMYDVYVAGGPWWLPSVRHVGNQYSTSGVRWGKRMVAVAVPFWMFGAAFGVAALLVWRFKRRRPGDCTCGYPLAGIDGPCPECGRPQHPASRAPGRRRQSDRQGPGIGRASRRRVRA